MIGALPAVRLKENSLDVTLEITRRCPLRCVFCSSNGGPSHPNELELCDWIRIVNESIDLGAKSFLISGGEPFTSKYFRELIAYISNKPVELSIYSSGNFQKGDQIISIPSEELEYLSSFKKIRMVMSLEAASSEIHDSITCREGSFSNTIKSIQNCVNLGLKTEIHFVPTRLNYHQIPEVIELSKILGVDQVSILRFVPQGRGQKNKKALELHEGDMKKLKKIFSDLVKYSDFVRIGSPFNPFLLSKQYRCTAGINRFTVRYDGLVVPCEAFKFLADIYLDDVDIKEKSLREIWLHSKLFTDVRRMHFITPSSDCYLCNELNRCGGGCPAQKILNSSITKIDPYCLKNFLKLMIAED